MKFGRKEPMMGSFVMDDGNNGETATLPRGPVTASLPLPRPGNGAGQALNAFLGDGCIYEGKLTFEGRVRIDGKFTGEIFSTDTLEVGPGAEIEAEIDVRQVIVAGRVEGNIHARGRCDLRAPGEIVGNIVSPVITMEEGVQFDGAMQMKAALQGALAISDYDEVVGVPTQRAPGALEAPEPLVADDISGVETGRRAAVPSRDPSELLEPGS